MRVKTPPPDPNVGIAQRESIDLARRVEDRNDVNDQYFRENFAPRYLQQMDDQIRMGREMQDYTMGLSRKYDDRFWNTTAKQQDRFYDEVDRYDTGAERDRIAGRAGADVEQAGAAGMQSLQRGMARLSMNPGSGAYASMLADQQRETSLSKAGAMTMAQEAARREGLNLRAVAAGMGGNVTGAAQGWSGQALGAAGLGMQGVQGAQQGFNSNDASFRSGAGVAGGLYGTVGQLGMGQQNAALQANMANASGMNQIIGTGAGAAIAFF